MSTALRGRPEVEHLFAADGTVDLEKVRRERARRVNLYQACIDDEVRRKILEQATADVVFFIDNFCWTYDPRIKMRLPMVLWPRQRLYVEFVEERVQRGEEFVTEKSRDVGVTYIHAAIAVHHWRFDPGYKTTFCANKLDLVDERGNPDSIFEKIRLIVAGLPNWVRPAGFRMSRNAREGTLINPANNNVISGEGGDNAGRGGRSTLYLIDEAAHVERADSVNAATSANARSRGWTSSVNGIGNLFYRFAHDSSKSVFSFHWRDDPRKNQAWAEQKKRDLTPEIFAKEYDLDYGASITGICIPMKWIDAARDLYRLLPEVVRHYRGLPGIGGWDVGGGKAESTLVLRHGPILSTAYHRIDPDSVDVAFWALEIARERKVGLLNYDSPGVGFAMGAILSRAETLDIQITAVNTGVPPTLRLWPDGRTSKDKFVNLKAELWGRARERFNKSWLLFRHLTGDPEGIDYPADEVVFLEDGDDELARQLATPKRHFNEAGKIMIETKDQLLKRGISSPDRADGAILSFFDDPSGVFIGAL